MDQEKDSGEGVCAQGWGWGWAGWSSSTDIHEEEVKKSIKLMWEIPNISQSGFVGNWFHMCSRRGSEGVGVGDGEDGELCTVPCKRC